MKTPWSRLLQHGTAFATIVVVSVSIVCLLIVVAIGVGIVKLSEFIR